MPTLDSCSISPGFPDKDKLIFEQGDGPKHTPAIAKYFQDNNIICYVFSNVQLNLSI